LNFSRFMEEYANMIQLKYSKEKVKIKKKAE
jgi:hypothetical protein